jgi:hypothetical protein
MTLSMTNDSHTTLAGCRNLEDPTGECEPQINQGVEDRIYLMQRVLWNKHVTEDLLVLMLLCRIWQSQFLGVQMLQNLFISPVTVHTNDMGTQPSAKS